MEGGGLGGGGRVSEWGQGGCDRRIEVFGKIHKKKNWGGEGFGGVGGGWSGVGGGRVGGGVRVDVNKELKGGGGRRLGWGGSGWM